MNVIALDTVAERFWAACSYKRGGRDCALAPSSFIAPLFLDSLRRYFRVEHADKPHAQAHHVTHKLARRAVVYDNVVQ